MVVVEEGENSFGAYVPDLPGCIAVAESRDEVLELIKEAIEFHLEGLRESGESIPPAVSTVTFAEVGTA
jgi:predicted RNase H-like HicB family nuclease